MPDLVEPDHTWWKALLAEHADGNSNDHLQLLLRAATRHNADLERQLHEAAERCAAVASLEARLSAASNRCVELEAQLRAIQQEVAAATASSRRWRQEAAAALAEREPLQEAAEKARQDLAEARRDSERWRRAADMLQQNLSAAVRVERSGPTPTQTLSRPDERYWRIKALLSKGLHPDNTRGISPEERNLREKIFKELWPHIERIDHER